MTQTFLRFRLVQLFNQPTASGSTNRLKHETEAPSAILVPHGRTWLTERLWIFLRVSRKMVECLRAGSVSNWLFYTCLQLGLVALFDVVTNLNNTSKLSFCLTGNLTETSQLRFPKIIGVHFENRTKPINTPFRQN